MSWCPLTSDYGEEGKIMECITKLLCDLRFFIACEKALCKLDSCSVVPYDVNFWWKLICREGAKKLEEMEEGSALCREARQLSDTVVTSFRFVSDYWT